MQHASAYVNFGESDDEDYVSVDEEDVTVGLQQVAAQPQMFQSAPGAPPQLQQGFGGSAPASGFNFGGFGDSSGFGAPRGAGSSSSSSGGFGSSGVFGSSRPSGGGGFSGFGSSHAGFGSSSNSGFGPGSSFGAGSGGFGSNPYPQGMNAFSFGQNPAAQGQAPPASSFGAPPASSGFSFASAPAVPVPTMLTTASVAPQAASSSVLRDQRKKKKSRRRRSRRAKEARHKVNTNVVSVDLGTLGSPANQIATGDPVFCQNEKCRTILTSLNEVQRENDDDMKLDEGECAWTCMFCGHRNLCDIEEEEQPQGESQDYMMEPPSTDAKSEDESIVVFCVDVSGSMCVTQEIQGKLKLRGSDSLRKLQSLNDDGSNQYFRHQRRDTTYVSRLQCVQAAIEDQLENLAENCPKQKVALVTFSSEVTIIGDGTEGTAEVVAGDKLHSEEACRAAGLNFGINAPVGDARELLSTALWNLEENGQTALGPALVVSIALASQRRGSRVVVCTDGLANVGLGSLDVDVTETLDVDERVGQWYENIGNAALAAGVTVNIVSITDDGCRMENLGKVADASRGEVQRINPLELTKNFKGILSKPVLATHVQARMFIHPGLNFRSDDEDRWTGFGAAVRESFAAESSAPVDPDGDVPVDFLTGDPASEAAAPDSADPAVEVSQQVQDIGNVFADSAIFFEYKVVKETIERYRGLDALPFQVQISYTRLDGAKMMRVITQNKPITTEREEVLKNMDYGVISSNAQRKTGRLCQDGDYESARINTFKTAVWMSEHARNAEQEEQNSGYMQQNLHFDGMMYQQQQADVAQGFSFGGRASASQQQARRSNRNDAFSSAMFGSKGGFGGY